MKRIALSDLVTAAKNIGMFSDRLARVSETTREETVQLNPVSFREMGRIYVLSIACVAETAKHLDLSATMAAASRCKSAFGKLTGAGGLIASKKTVNEIVVNSQQLTTSLSDELEKHLAFVVAPREVPLIEDGLSQFGLDLVQALPMIREDVIAAAQCRAFELWTASVMHMMRVAEVGVGAFVEQVGMTKGKTWGDTIGKMIKKLDEERFPGISAEQKQWASETASYLNFVKDAFRNPAMHPEMTFDRDQAISIYDNTRAFTRMLVKRNAFGQTV